MSTITSSQCRAARGLLKWGQSDLSQKCDVHIQTICAFENETGTPTKRTLRRISVAFEKEGLEFLSGSGVRRLDTSIRILHGDEGFKSLMDDIYETVIEDSYKYVLIANSTEPTDLGKTIMDHLEMHLKRLKDANIHEQILCCEGDTNFLGPQSAYRWIPKENFCNIPTFIYGSKVAMAVWGVAGRVTIINDPQYAESMRNLFTFSWKHARTPEI